jgi:hypothetical protein
MTIEEIDSATPLTGMQTIPGTDLTISSPDADTIAAVLAELNSYVRPTLSDQELDLAPRNKKIKSLSQQL